MPWDSVAVTAMERLGCAEELVARGGERERPFPALALILFVGKFSLARMQVFDHLVQDGYDFRAVDKVIILEDDLEIGESDGSCLSFEGGGSQGGNLIPLSPRRGFVSGQDDWLGALRL